MSTEEITWKGRCGPFQLRVDKSTFRPTTISLLVADSLEIEEGETVIDLGCGSGVLSIVAAKLGAGMVHGVDPAEGTVAVAKSNAEANGVADRTRFYQGDLFQPLPESVTADVVIGDVSGIPDDLARVSGWFPAGHYGGPSGAELPMRMLDEAKRRLGPGGRLILPTGSLQDEDTILDKARSVFATIRNLAERRIPLPSSLADHPAVAELIKRKIVELTRRGSRALWTARVWEFTG